MSDGLGGWTRVSAPGGALCWGRGGDRFFVELNPAVIVPLAKLLAAKNAGRDQRRKAAGYQVVETRRKVGAPGGRLLGGAAVCAVPHRGLPFCPGLQYAPSPPRARARRAYC